MANSVSSGTLMAVDQTVQIPVAEFGSVGIQLSGTWVGTVQFECGILSPTVSTGLVSIQVASPTGALVSSATANGLWQVSSGGLSVVRVRCSAYTSGAILVALQASPASAGGAGGAGAATSLAAGSTVGTTVATAATLSNVASSVTTVTLLAANAARRGFMIVNDETSTLLVKFGATASATSFTVSLVAAAYYECPQPVYTGLVAGIWTAAGSGSGAARITEIT